MATLDALLQLQRLITPVGFGGGGTNLDPRALQEAMRNPQNPQRIELPPPPAPLPPALPPGLPDAVVQSIRTQPSYGEGQVMPRPTDRPGWNRYSDFGRERQLNELGQWGLPGREDRLVDELEFQREALPSLQLPEGRTARPAEVGSPYSSRELGFGYPFALY